MKMRLHDWLVCLCLIALAAAASGQTPDAVAPRDRILILVSLDGFRWDYLQKFKAQTPHLNELAGEGVRAQRLISAFPSLTFPNHYTIVTGLWPEHHGIVNNSMYDPNLKAEFHIMNNPGPTDGRWWGGEPIWVTAIKQGRFADCMFWPGSEAEIDGVRPTNWKPFDAKISPDSCVDAGLGWLAQTNQRPSLLTLYFHEVDTESHHHGVDSPQVARAVSQVDEAIGRLTSGLHRLQLENIASVIIVSDHGMTDLSTNRVIVLGDYVDLNSVRVDATGAIAGLRPLDGNVDALYNQFVGKENHFRVYRRENMPARFHYTASPRIPQVILVADEGWYISKRKLDPARAFENATHGFDPELESMGATFIAWGPAFRHGVVLPPEQNVNIYDLLCATLGLTPAPNDGDQSLVNEVLAK
ncbi:MAG TPA: ectonucleotide pyrophosphatase/phosphodiesterase [Verrucomicrobiae bacterium]|jgi:predicted AlkP superfamily pyrophosphatase or phosphodiesterase|nr:ectonucleotide pyrophosphatase/phosphodiesterase [Verrucomicrobiae bacterium]